MVGPVRFELTTSCTPSTQQGYTCSMHLGVFYNLHGFGAPASAHRNWRWDRICSHFSHADISRWCVGRENTSGRPVMQLRLNPTLIASFHRGYGEDRTSSKRVAGGQVLTSNTVTLAIEELR